MTSTILNRPADYRHVPAAEWTELNSGDPVWIYDVAWGAGTGRVDDVSKHQELLWVVLGTHRPPTDLRNGRRRGLDRLKRLAEVAFNTNV